ncbi:hypothetical protein NON20_02465 [Synechocystis sp. B12]|nr:hypothetical protein NON20_02465 [Synechocystis sp. B12]
MTIQPYTQLGLSMGLQNFVAPNSPLDAMVYVGRLKPAMKCGNN